MNLTPWYYTWQKPVREGVYQTILFRQVGYSFWDGRFWRGQFATPARAFTMLHFGQKYPSMQWRGVAK